MVYMVVEHEQKFPNETSDSIAILRGTGAIKFLLHEYVRD